MAVEICNGRDDDCADGDIPCLQNCVDMDLDGFGEGGVAITSLEVGPQDGKLYASSIMGTIQRWDLNPDGTLDKAEQVELRKTMVHVLLNKYNAVPKADDEERQGFLKKYTRDLDKLVVSETFVKDLNLLQQKTATAMDKDSTQMFTLLQPDTMKKHERKLRKSAGEVMRAGCSV